MTSALDVAEVRVRLGDRDVLDGLSLSIEPGQVRALVGLNGAGKTTALRVVLGMLHPDAGRVHVLGHEIASGSRKPWGHVGHLIETPFCYPELTARENIAAAADLHGAERRRAARRAEVLSEALGLSSWLDTRVRRLSLGTRQKVGLVSALAHDPALVVLDEPTNGLDPLAVVAFRDLVHDIAEEGSAVLVTSHHFDELARIAGQVDVLHRGRIIATLTPGGPDLERVFFDTIVAAEHAAQESR